MGIINWFKKAADTCKTACDNLANGSKYREEAKHYREIKERLERDYSELEIKYQELEQRAREEIEEYAFALAQVRMVVKLGDDVVTLLQLAYETGSEEICQQLTDALSYTNRIRGELGIEPLRVSIPESKLGFILPEAKVKEFIIPFQQGLSGSALGRRLGVSKATVSTHRNKGDLECWSVKYDPEQLRWSYDSNSKRYFPLYLGNNHQ